MISADGVVDLRSDTVTRPSAGMRQAIAGAAVGDDVLEKDPTVDRLERRVAELLGKESALFFPTGTQANQAAILLHTSPGSEAVCEAESHVFHFELAGAARHAGVQLHPVRSDRGSLRPEDVAAVIRPGDRHHPLTGLVCVENTHNLHGGTVVGLDELEAVRDVAQQHGLPVHLDGARLWNASEASGVSLAAYSAAADTVMVCLSKGLGCPIGSMLVGPAGLVQERGWSVRKSLGGGMRQVGVLAAAGLYALDHNLARLADDHQRAAALAEACNATDGLRADRPDTNIVMIHVERPGVKAQAVADGLAARGVWILLAGSNRLRAVTHLDVDDAGIERAADALREVLG